ncbi:MAG: hypothetical protein MUO68_00225 [Desulfobacteraceae bacterium]|nr:hypothetical protein [Desulfobacteraceae bacterium]
MDLKDSHRAPVLLKEMRQKINEIERLVLELKELGAGVPVVEKNARAILSFINVLKVGISDVAEIGDNEEVRNG